jgi:uncharacterized protein
LTVPPVVADAGPLIGLARAGRLDLLRQLYTKVIVPAEVLEELQTTAERPGSRALRGAVEQGWLFSVPAMNPSESEALRFLGPGEAGAILWAEKNAYRFLLFDERQGRAVAKSRGLRVVGTAGVLVVAKEQGLIERVADVLDQLAANGYRLSAELRNKTLTLAGELLHK